MLANQPTALLSGLTLVAKEEEGMGEERREEREEEETEASLRLKL
jgi:hypothetical protein